MGQDLSLGPHEHKATVVPNSTVPPRRSLEGTFICGSITLSVADTPEILGIFNGMYVIHLNFMACFNGVFMIYLNFMAFLTTCLRISQFHGMSTACL